MKWLRRIGIALLIILLLLVVLPFVIPIDDTGIDPAQLVDDDNGAFITLQDVRVYYEDYGDPDDPALLLVHGLFGSTESWRYNVEALAEAGYRVISFDRPGFGLSDKVESFNYAVANQTDLMVALLDALDIERADIIGHSAGGNVATHFAVRHPQYTNRLVLVDAAVLTGGPPGFVGGFVALPPVWRWGRIGLQAVFTREQLENSLQGFYVDPSFLTEADYDAYWRAFQTPGWEIGLLGLTRDSAGNLLSEDAIRGIDAPTLILWGAEDTVTPLEAGERLNELIPGSRLEVIPAVGHQPFEEAPQVFNETLLAFLDEGR